MLSPQRLRLFRFGFHVPLLREVCARKLHCAATKVLTIGAIRVSATNALEGIWMGVTPPFPPQNPNTEFALSTRGVIVQNDSLYYP